MAIDDVGNGVGGRTTAIPEGGVGFWRQTRLLVEKNWRCKIRTDKKKLLGEIFLPVLYLFLLSFLVKSQPKTVYPAETVEDPPVSILEGLGTTTTSLISVVPDSTEAKDISQRMLEIWKQKAHPSRELTFMYYATQKELEDAHLNGTKGTDLAIVFLPISPANNVSFSYTIMTEAGGLFSPPSTRDKMTGLDTCRNRDSRSPLEFPSSCPVNGYFYSGFLALQYLADQALLQYSGAMDSDGNFPDVNIQNYPKQAYTEGMSAFLRAIIPLYSVIPMAQLINSLLVMIVTEKEDRIKDGFRMIGVADGAYWLSWFSVYAAIIGVLSVMFTLVMHFTNVLTNINIVLLFLIFFLFGLSVITFAFALTPFFHKPKTAGVVGTLIMQFCGMLFMLQTFLKTPTDAFLLPLRLISSLAFTTALDEACEYEFHGGVGFSDLLPGRRGARILYSLIFICFDTVFYGIIAIYLDNVIPNEYGARKHPLFCFTSLFSRPDNSMGYVRSSLSQENINESSHNPNVESVPASMLGKEAIRIRNVHKTYTSLFGSTKVKAVKGISLDIYDGQITAILGKNGAGKSTLFSILTGLVPPSSGNCTVFGMNTSDPVEMDRLRRITGVCLQSDLLFPSLTVEEHLELYGKLRGLDGDALSNDIHSLLQDLKLAEKANTRAANLSGGQKRKLSVAISLIGDPKIIMLDEPSAGVDPVSRRHLWSLLKRKKEGRVILLTTHFLDEADFLADRKAIIQEGVLKCHGSSLFLKNKFGVGYHLTLETEGPFDAGDSDSIVQKWLPQALSSKHVIGREIKYCLPHSEVHVFADLFSDLEKLIEMPQSSFKSYGVSMTTLEEVFLKISNDAWEDKNKPTIDEENGNPNVGDNNEECNLIPDLSEIKINFAESLWVLCLLRIRRLIRSPQSFFFMIVMPSVLVAVGLALIKAQTISMEGELMSFNLPKDIYSDENQRRLAISSINPAPDHLLDFLNVKGFSSSNYSGKYSDLLQTKLSDIGTMAAISFSKSEDLAKFSINGTFLHSPPLLINMMSQFYWGKYSNNATLNATTKSFAPKKSAINASTFYAVFLIGPSFTFAAVGMVMELVKDREINARDHLRVNGVSFGLYFLSFLIVFGVLSAIVTFMQISLIYIFAIPSFMNPYALTVTIVLLLLFIPSCLLFSTVFSYMFDRLESAQSIFSPVSSWMGTIVGIVIIVMDGLSELSGNKNVLIAHAIFSALDVFYIPFGIFYWVNKQYTICTIRDTCDQLSFKDYMGSEIIIMAVCLLVQIPIFALAVIVVDVVKSEGKPMAVIRAIFMKKKSDLNLSQMNILSEEDYEDSASAIEEDVLVEKTRVSNLLNGTAPRDNSVVIVKNLKKTYLPTRSIKDRCKNRNTKGHQALKGINFAVEKGEVFGLLGHNGAGKTTAMRIIIAQESADSGRVRLCGSDIDSSYSDAFLKLGYCAQHDPLWENIRLKEHLELYSVIRGIPKSMRKRVLSQLVNGLQIQEHASKKASQLSGGTKRKLSYAISILGIPKIVLLDEPSTGMDPQSKRFLWNTILGSFKESRGAILTTHSMEEAEILCTRIAILAKGSLICIGSPQHLKSKYGKGYMLEIKLKAEEATGSVQIETSAEERYAFVHQNFPDCTVNEIFNDKAVFSLPTTSVKSISQAFALLEKLKIENNIEEYSFSQTTLEQIFLQFAKDEDDEDDNASVAEDSGHDRPTGRC